MGRDAQNQKTTYLTLLGLHEAKSQAKALAQKAVAHAAKLPGNAEILAGLAQFSADRVSLILFFDVFVFSLELFFLNFGL